MKKIDLNATIQTAANVGVVAGIAFLVFEIQQNTDAIRSATVQAISEQSYESVRIAIDNSELREAMRAVAAGEVSEQQQQLLNMFYGANLRIAQNQYQQREIGVLDEGTSAELGTGGLFLTSGFAAYWAENRGNFTSGFQDYIDRLIRERSQRRQ